MPPNVDPQYPTGRITRKPKSRFASWYLEEAGILTLPAKRDTGSGAPRPIARAAASDPQPEIACDLAALEPLSLVAADGSGEKAEWNELAGRHQCLGCPRPFGRRLRWFVPGRDGRRLGCLLFEAAARTLPDRDAWTGWSDRDRERRLHLALGSSRLLLFPWVRVPNLASRALGMAAARLPDEWQRRHGCRPALLETFIDPTRFDGTCYRAANQWHCFSVLAAPPDFLRQAHSHAVWLFRACAALFRLELTHGPDRSIIRPNQSVPREATMNPSADSLESAIFRGHRLIRWQVAATRETVELPPNGGSGWTSPAGSRLKRPVLRFLEWLRAMIAAIRLMAGGTGGDSSAAPRVRPPGRAGFTHAIAAVTRMAGGIAACQRERPGRSCPGMLSRPDSGRSRKEKATIAS